MFDDSPVGTASSPGHAGGVPAAGFRVVVTGKGGVGKTSLTALMARLLARQDHRVLALDADPQMNLAYALGLPFNQARALVPISQNRPYVEEKKAFVGETFARIISAEAAGERAERAAS
ncbi:MAG: AAA family ATPase [Acidimicrobiia bacterium]